VLNAARKGKRVERELVRDLEGIGLKARRQPSSGAFGTRVSETRLTGDVLVQIGGEEWRIECKARRNGEGFVTLERWMAGCDALMLKRDRATPMWVITHEMFLKLCGGRDED